MRSLIPLNYDWKFSDSFMPEYSGAFFDDSAFSTVCLPHTNREIPYNYVNETDCQFICCYRKRLVLGEKYRGKRLALVFMAAGHYAKIYVNGTFAAEHRGGYTSFEVDITSLVVFDKPNVIAVELDATERDDLPPFGYVIDYLTYGGLYREVYLKVTETTYIEDVFVYADGLNGTNPRVIAEVRLSAPSPHSECRVLIAGTTQIAAASEKKLTFSFNAASLQRWELDNPQLYTAEVSLHKADGIEIDRVAERFGVRHAQFASDGFYLNGKKIKIVGLNRHQSYAYAGYAMPKSRQERDAEILKNELGVNLARTSHYPQSKHFINRCDELGLLVFTEIPGWQHIGKSTQWRQTALDHTREMVLQYRNHPSIILWGVRINESPDCDELYFKTNETAHALDPTRETGGVRCIKHSRLLEDVYTYNDFIHGGANRGLENPNRICPKTSPYLVTEHNGHKFSTKRFDDESHRRSQAMRHCAVLRDMLASSRISGAIGWCMSDYNTHKDFGSGDGICYHGVTDMFRMPKFAAAVYASQQERIPVLQISSTMQIGDHPDSMIGEIVAFSNADSIRVYKNGALVNEFFPDKKNYPHFAHPPFFLSDLFGDFLVSEEKYSPATAAGIKDVLLTVNRCGQKPLPLRQTLKMAWLMLSGKITRKKAEDLYSKYLGNWGAKQFSFSFEAVKNGQVIKTIIREPVNSVTLRLVPDTEVLVEGETYDVTCVAIEACDQNGNLLPYYQEAVRLQLDGPGTIIGPELLSLKGGAAAVYVKSAGKTGTLTLRVTSCDGSIYERKLECRSARQEAV